MDQPQPQGLAIFNHDKDGFTYGAFPRITLSAPHSITIHQTGTLNVTRANGKSCYAGSNEAQTITTFHITINNGYFSGFGGLNNYDLPNSGNCSSLFTYVNTNNNKIYVVANNLITNRVQIFMSTDLTGSSWSTPFDIAPISTAGGALVPDTNQLVSHADGLSMLLMTSTSVTDSRVVFYNVPNDLTTVVYPLTQVADLGPVPANQVSSATKGSYTILQNPEDGNRAGYIGWNSTITQVSYAQSDDDSGTSFSGRYGQQGVTSMPVRIDAFHTSTTMKSVIVVMTPTVSRVWYKSTGAFSFLNPANTFLPPGLTFLKSGHANNDNNIDIEGIPAIIVTKSSTAGDTYFTGSSALLKSDDTLGHIWTPNNSSNYLPLQQLADGNTGPSSTIVVDKILNNFVISSAPVYSQYASNRILLFTESFNYIAIQKY